MTPATVLYRLHGHRELGDHGAISALVVVLFLALLTAAGLVVDGGAKIRAARQASATAEEAARASAGHVDQAHAYTHGGRFRIDPAAAVTAARAYLTGTGTAGTVTVTSGTALTVTVTVTKPALLLTLIGITHLRATKTATADLLTGDPAGNSQ